MIGKALVKGGKCLKLQCNLVAPVHFCVFCEPEVLYNLEHCKVSHSL